MSDTFSSRLRAALDLLENIAGDWGTLDRLSPDERQRLHRIVAQLYNPDPIERRNRVKAVERARKAAGVEREDRVLDNTGIRSLRQKPIYTTPNVFAPDRFAADDRHEADGQRDPDSDEAVPGGDACEDEEPSVNRHCYVCKQTYTAVHHFYDQLCPSCAELNYAKRTETVDLTGRVALVTGARVKIGYYAGLKLLRSGAHLIVTTRFPRDSAARYAREPDFYAWRDRLEIFGLDLRHTPSVDAFCRHLLATHARLDFIVNNACQTVRRPPDFYRHMMETEQAIDAAAPEQRALVRGVDMGTTRGDPHDSAQLSQIALLPEELVVDPALFPSGRLDQDRQQVDLRGRNSWRLLLDEVSTIELLEVQLVNAIAPFVLNARLKPLMLRTANRDKHIVNVSAVEGQFYRRFKTTRHPHTNMAKAALNMMTRTAATGYHSDGIHMNSVDTGWVTDEDPVHIASRKRTEQRFHPPLDVVDGAARILDPIVNGLATGVHQWGLFLKDYRSVDW